METIPVSIDDIGLLVGFVIRIEKNLISLHKRPIGSVNKILLEDSLDDINFIY